MAGLKGERDEVPGLPVGLWALGGVFVCLSALGLQHFELHRLRREVAWLSDNCGDRRVRREGGPQVNHTQESRLMSHSFTGSARPEGSRGLKELKEPRSPCSSARSPGCEHRVSEGSIPPKLVNVSGSLAAGAGRAKRATRGQRRARPRKRESFIHLAPSSCSSVGDTTIIFWRTVFQGGKSFDHTDNTVTLTESGYFFIYAQVLYQDSTFVMGHFVKQTLQRTNSARTILKCLQSMPESYPSNTCYTAGVHKLEKGDVIEVIIPRVLADIGMQQESTFLGLYKL